MILFLLAGVVIFLLKCTLTQQTSDVETNALFDFYNATNGIDWDYSSNATRWTFYPADPCTDNWDGVTCSSSFQITGLNLTNKALSGSLPSSIGNLLHLEALILTSNSVTGSIPSSIGNLTSLTHLNLGANSLDGTIPSDIGNLTSLVYLGLFENSLSNVVPTTLSNLNALWFLLLYDNKLDGSFPGYIVDMPSFYVGGLGKNCFSGSLPSGLWDITEAVLLDFAVNKLTGTIPNMLVPHKLHHLNLGENFLNGTIPSGIANFVDLESLFLYNNSITGTIPASIEDLSSTLSSCYLQDNMLTGSIPSGIGENFTVLEYFSVGSNSMTGTVPPTLGNSPLLKEFDVSFNSFHSRVGDMTSPYLELVLVNNNAFTGSLPSAPFLNQDKLRTFVASVNCFEGTLPSTLCSNNTNAVLEKLVLDGLSSASTCKARTILTPFSTYYIKNDVSVHGTVPNCLFELSSLDTLQLTGNAFTGSLDVSDTYDGGKLKALLLSHNILDGSIPLGFQRQGNWTNFDLSFNRFTGSLSPDFAVDNSTTYALSLFNNRLSGAVPSTLLDMADISIFGTNLFSCNWDKSDLPTNDQNASEFLCGSSAIRGYFVSWACLTGILIISLIFIWKRNDLLQDYVGLDMLGYFNRWFCLDAYLTGDFDKRIGNFDKLLNIFILMASVCTAYILVILLPLYCILTLYYSTYTHEYAYFYSAVYISGKVPFWIEFSFWLCFLGLMFFLAEHVIKSHRKQEIVQRINVPCDKHKIRSGRYALGEQGHGMSMSAGLRVYTPSQQLILYTVILGVNVVAMCVLNGAFVYVSLHIDGQYLLSVQTAFAVLKLIWNEKCFHLVLQYASYVAGVLSSETQFANLQMFVNLFNTVLIPLFVVAVMSSNCYNNIVIPAPQITSTYETSNRDCFVLENDCYYIIPTKIIQSSYQPPFRYSYQCSAGVITYYAPAYVAMCVVDSYLVPLGRLSLLKLYSSATTGTIWRTLLDQLLPKGLKLQSAAEAASSAADAAKAHFKSSIVRVNHKLTKLGGYFGILVTMGVMFPPLALVLLVTIIVECVFTKLQLGRMIAYCTKHHQWYIVKEMENDCRVSVSVIGNLMRMLLFISCLFYSCFLFDTLGDAEGFQQSFWIFFVMFLIPLVVHVGHLSRELIVQLDTEAVEEDPVVDKSALELSMFTKVSGTPLEAEAVGEEDDIWELFLLKGNTI